MLLKQIEYFQAVVDTGNFTLAGEKCHISQSAISQQIKTLEDELGIKLLDRHNRTFTLTKAGEFFYRKSAVLLYDAQQLKKEIMGFGKDDRPSLKIGYLNCFDSNVFQDAVTTFSERFPQVDLQILSGSHEELYNALRREDVDLVVNDQRRAFSDDYVNFELVKSHSYIEISSKHPFAKLDHINVSDLKSFTCILLAEKEHQENEIAYYRDIVGLTGDYIFSNSLQEARILAAAGKGFLPVEGIRDDVYYDSSIRRIPLYKKEKPLLRNYCAFWKKENESQYAKEFAAIVKERFLP